MTAARHAPERAGYRPDIDGLRAIAVLAVIINHLNQRLLPGGYLGVDAFFVISGYVITGSLGREGGGSLGAALAGFYLRRVKRLLPALVPMVLIAGLLIRLFDPSPIVSTITGASSVFGFSNIFLFTQALNYFGKSAQLNMFSHTWSLGVEEQFYLIYPLLLLWTPRFLAGRRKLWAIAGLSAVSLLAFAITYRTNQPAAYFLMPLRFWELGAGCVLSLLTRDLPAGEAARFLRIGPLWPLVLLAAPLALGELLPVASTIGMVVLVVLLIGSAGRSALVTRVLTHRAVVYLGLISYSLYLWHWPVICLSRWTIGLHVWSLPFQLGAMLALAVASYHGLERPLRRARWIGGRWGSAIVGAPLALATAGVLLLSQKYGLPAFSGDPQRETASRAPTPDYVSRASHIKVEPCYAGPLFKTAPDPAAAIRQRCTGDLGSPTRLIFAGDSHATDLLPMADRLFADKVATIVYVGQPGCQFPALSKDAARCDFGPALMKTLAAGGSGHDILILRNNMSPHLATGDLPDFDKRLSALLDAAARAGMKVVYIAPGPKYARVGPANFCRVEWYRPAWAVDPNCRKNFVEDRAELLARRREFVDYLTGLSRRRNDFFVFDPFDTLCGGAGPTCTPVRNGELIYRDDSHLTENGSERLTAPFEAFLRDHGLAAAPPPPEKPS